MERDQIYASILGLLLAIVFYFGLGLYLSYRPPAVEVIQSSGDKYAEDVQKEIDRVREEIRSREPKEPPRYYW